MVMTGGWSMALFYPHDRFFLRSRQRSSRTEVRRCSWPTSGTEVCPSQHCTWSVSHAIGRFSASEAIWSPGWGPAPCGGPQPTPNHGAWPAPGLLTCSSSRAIRASWDWAFCREVENVHFPPSPFYGPGCSGGHRLIWGVAPSQSNGGSRPRVDARSAGAESGTIPSLQMNGASTGWIARSARVVQLLLGPACLYLSFEETAVLAGANRKHTDGPERNLLEAPKRSLNQSVLKPCLGKPRNRFQKASERRSLNAVGRNRPERIPFRASARATTKPCQNEALQ